MRSTSLRLGLLALGGLALAAAAAAGEEPHLEPGSLVERVTCAGAPGQSYALYLPPSYDPERRWPVVFVMDARGRALYALERFRDGAARFGYLLVSSYNTASDGPSRPNFEALDAMLHDTERRLPLDPERIYLAGFSGTARSAWLMAHALSEHTAGVIGASGGLPPGVKLPEKASFDFFGTTGTTDFNYQEMRRLDRTLDDWQVHHRFAEFEGGHDWPPVELASRALAWMEVQAMNRGLRTTDPALLEDLLSEVLEEAESRRAAGDLLASYRLYRAAADDFAPLPGAEVAATRAASLERSRELGKLQKEEHRLASQEAAFERRLASVVQKIRQTSVASPSHVRLQAELQLPSLLRLTEEETGTPAAESARRRLATANVQLSFYLPRELLAAKQYGGAAVSLELALEIDPSRPFVWYNLACAQAQTGRRDRALESLERAVELGFGDAELLATDEDLAPLRGTDAYRAMLERLRAR